MPVALYPNNVVLHTLPNNIAMPCRPDLDPLPDVEDPRAALAQALGTLAAAQPGRVPQLVAAALSPEQQQKLAGYCAAAGVAIA